MASLSAPTQFGDVEGPSIEEDARGYLGGAIREIRFERGPQVAAMAREVLGVLAENDALRGRELIDAVAETLDTRMEADSDSPELIRSLCAAAIACLVHRLVLTESNGRYSLNPAVARVIGRPE